MKLVNDFDLPENLPTRVLRATDKRGNVFFYTGKAGPEWVSADVSEAFYYTPSLAIEKAEWFNRSRQLTGLSFTSWGA